MKNKKIISLICALAMVFSMFSAFTVVNAENTKGIALTSSISKDNKTITVTATAVGVADNKVNSYQISLNVPDGVTLDDIKYTSEKDPTSTGLDNGIYNAVFFDVAGVAFKDNKIATIEITLPTALDDDYVITLQDESTISDADGEVKVGKGTMDASTTTATPEGLNKPTIDQPAKVEEPITPDVPKPVEPTGKGIALTSSLDKTGKVVTVTATAVGVADNKVNSYQISLNVPDGVTLDDIKYTSEKDPTSTGLDNGIYNAVFFDVAGVAFKDNKIATIEITLPTAVTEPMAVTLQGESTISDADGEVKVGKGTMTASSTVVEPAGSTVKPVKTANLKDYVSNGGAAAAKAAQDAGKTVYLTVDVKKADGSAAVYGTDFDAEYPAGTKLTEAAYNNLIHGYDENADMSDVITNLKYNVYNNDVKSISTTLNAKGYKRQLVPAVEDKTIGKTTTPTEKKPSIGVTLKPSTATVGTKVTVTAKVTNPKDDGVLTVTASDDSLDYVTGSGIKNTVAEDNKSATTTFTGAVAKSNAIVLDYTYTYTDINGETQTVTAQKKITIKAAGGSNNSSNGSSDSESSGTGVIANGAMSGVSNGEYYGQFSDLGNVQWAWEAINTLADKNIVSGRGNGIFDPDANITRAEYCQILIGAIEKTSEYADASFDDVPTDAWFYHAVAVASKYGIVSGYGDGNFGPYDLITRQDMALMTYKAAQAMNVNLTAQQSADFTDGAEVADYAAEAVNTLYSAGIINGMGDGTFAPKNNATRAQASVIIYQTFVK